MVDIQSPTAEIRRGKQETRMWVIAQRDGRRAVYSWRPLFNPQSLDGAHCSNAVQ